MLLKLKWFKYGNILNETLVGQVLDSSIRPGLRALRNLTSCMKNVVAECAKRFGENGFEHLTIKTKSTTARWDECYRAGNLYCRPPITYCKRNYSSNCSIKFFFLETESISVGDVLFSTFVTATNLLHVIGHW